MSCHVPLHPRIALCGLLTLLFLAPAANAADEKVTVSVVAILATDKNDKIEPPKIKEIAAELQKINPKLTGFHSPKETKKDIPLNSPEKFTLVDDQVVVIEVERAADQDNKNVIRVQPPTLGEIKYDTSCGKFFPIITKYETKDGEVLIIAIRVQPCKGK
jgi:hypothetical protein